jgi:tetratricopeptide (TPR) repeat protein
MKRYLIAAAASLALLAGFALNPVSAASLRNNAPVQDAAKEQADLYGKIYEASKNNDCAKVMELGKEYLQKFPDGQYAKWVKETGIPRCRSTLLGAAVKEKNVAEILRLGKDALASDPDNVDFVVFLAGQLGQLEILASPPNLSHATDASEFAQRSIKLIEGGKAPSGADFKKEATLAYMNRLLAVVEKNNKNIDKAISHYEKAASYEPANPQWFLSCGSLYQEKYAAAATKFQAFSDEDRAAEPDKMKPEVKAALDAVNKEADAVIKCWARFMGLTTDKKEWDALRAQVQPVLTELYKFRHDGKTDGLQQLIDQNRAGTPPASNGTNSSRS